MCKNLANRKFCTMMKEQVCKEFFSIKTAFQKAHPDRVMPANGECPWAEKEQSMCPFFTI